MISFIVWFFCRLIRRPKRGEIVPPYVPWSHLVVKPPPITDTVFWLFDVCLFIVWWPLTATECIFSFHFSSLESPSKTTGNRPPRTFCRGRIASQIPAPSLVLFLVGCCVVSANDGRLKLRLGPSLYFFVAPFAAPNDRKKSSPRVPPRSRLITAKLWLVVVSIEKTAATQDRCSAHLSIFRWVPLGRPNQGILPQRAQARATGACSRLIGSRGETIRVHGGCFHGEGGRSRWG